MPDPTLPAGPPASELYVGYLPVPPRQKRFLRIVVPALLWCVALAAFLISRSQGNPGSAEWESGHVRTFVGTVLATPYPVLFAVDRGDGTPGAILLVEAGKHGATRAAEFDGRRVSVNGWVLHREGRTMLELEPGTEAIARLDGASNLPEVHARGHARLQGEIVDSKCFLGAMKPGNGKTHKECATLCISGGIPPMFVTRDAAGRRSYYLLVNPNGGPLDRAAFDRIADPVELEGELEEWGGMLRIRVEAGNIRRL